MFVYILLIVLSILKTDSEDLIIERVLIIDSEMSIDIKLKNSTNSSFVIYRPTLESMMGGILNIELVNRKKNGYNYDLNPFEVIKDIDRIFLTKNNAFLLNKDESCVINIKVPLSGQKGKFKLKVTLNYADTVFVFKDMFTSDKILNKVLEAEMEIKI